MDTAHSCGVVLWEFLASLVLPQLPIGLNVLDTEAPSVTVWVLFVVNSYTIELLTFMDYGEKCDYPL